MSKPTTYFHQNEQIDTLVECFGSQLEVLTIAEKLALNTTISHWVMHQEIVGNSLGEFTLEHAFEEITCGWLERARVHQAVQILDGINERDALGVMEALVNQLRWS